MNINDSVTITDNGTEIVISSFFGTKEAELPLPYSKIGKIDLDEHKSTYLTFLEPDRRVEIEVLKDSSITTKRVVDSLLNYLSINTLDYLNENLNFIYSTDNLDSIVRMLNAYKLEREQLILNYSDRLSASEIEVLKFYNNTRLQGFLQVYGLIHQKISAENSFYDFTEEIDLSDDFIKSAPYLYLNKLKIQFLREFGPLKNLSDFLDYIEAHWDNRDISDFMKFMFIKELTESSQFWERELELLDVNILEAIIEKEGKNKYSHLMRKFSDKFFLTQKGKKADNFIGEWPDGSVFHLNDLNGKVVFIDVWATWCGPCLEVRPRVIDLADKFKENPDVEVLMVSVDDSREKWLNYLKVNNETSANNVFVKNGMREDFGRQFNINQIPNYILIDKQGLFVDAYIKDLSDSVEEMIVKELSK